MPDDYERGVIMKAIFDEYGMAILYAVYGLGYVAMLTILYSTLWA